MSEFDRIEFELGRVSRMHRFQELMRHRIEHILLISSLYDLFVLTEEGGLYESLYNEYVGLELTHVPRITRVSGYEEALQSIENEPDRFDLVINSLPVKKSQALKFNKLARNAGIHIPIILLAWDERHDLKDIERDREEFLECDQVYVWQGDFSLFLAIIKQTEDRLNLDHDIMEVGVQYIILIEDDIWYYSSFLPVIYEEMMLHTKNLISEGVNQSHRRLRMRARPKIIHCTSYDEAWSYFQKYHSNLLGVVTDIAFPKNGEKDPEAGFKFVQAIRKVESSIPVIFQSSQDEHRDRACQYRGEFLRKDSDSLLKDLRVFMETNLGFGEFVFRNPDGSVVAVAQDMREFMEKLRVVPESSLCYHASNNHFSKWLQARTEHSLAARWKVTKFSDYESIQEAREFLVESMADYLREQSRGHIIDFDKKSFELHQSFVQIGGGSLGGKGRGLGFVNQLIDRYGLSRRFLSTNISIPNTLVVNTEVFDKFIHRNDLGGLVSDPANDEELLQRFLNAKFPEETEGQLEAYLDEVSYPLSIRSSSLLEDAQDMPFAGVYHTYMIPNIEDRLESLILAIKRIYASTFLKSARRYMRSSPYRLEEEKMAIIIQQLVGKRHGQRFYPDFSGVSMSHNFYPIDPMKSGDGIASVALGFGKTVVEGGNVVRFCPKYPKNILQFSTIEDTLIAAQRNFYALNIPDTGEEWDFRCKPELQSYDLTDAIRDGVFRFLGSTYNAENNILYDSADREGVPVVTFSPVLKREELPLAAILRLLLDMGEYCMNAPVEIEFAGNFSRDPKFPHQFYLLQIRPMALHQEKSQYQDIRFEEKDLVCKSRAVMGNGVVNHLKDIVIVDPKNFDRSCTKDIAREISQLNDKLLSENRQFIIIGLGRLGSSDPWLGIPVDWSDICGAKVIVEAEMPQLSVTPSQGTHFFHNITSFKIGYFTISSSNNNGFVNWEWFDKLEPVKAMKYTKHFQFEEPFSVIMNGHRNTGIISIPGSSPYEKVKKV